MDVFEAIHSRRSVRKYTEEDVPEELVRKLLGAAMMAPSAGDERAWQFIVVRSDEQKERVRDVHPYAKMITRAPLGILVCGDLSLERYEGFWTQDCSAAMQNLLLAAHGSGLGAVWTGVHPMADRVAAFREVFELPEHVIPLGFAVIGWPAKGSEPEDRFDASRVHSERWGQRSHGKA